MAARVSITTSPELQSRAASLLSQYLVEVLKCPHAFIGGFAWALLGSNRPTQINVLIETKNLDVLELREKLENMDERFASAGIKWYFVHEPVEALRGEALVRASRDNVLIETLRAGTLGLPVVAEPIYFVEHPSGASLAILYPPVLLLTKMKRWYTTYESTRPKTVSKTQSDKNDLDYLIFWLSQKEMKIDFELYKGKEKPELLKVVRAYRDKYHDDADLMEALQEVLHGEDWDALQVAQEIATSMFALPSAAGPEVSKSEAPFEPTPGTSTPEATLSCDPTPRASTPEPALPTKPAPGPPSKSALAIKPPLKRSASEPGTPSEATPETSAAIRCALPSEPRREAPTSEPSAETSKSKSAPPSEPSSSSPQQSDRSPRRRASSRG